MEKQGNTNKNRKMHICYFGQKRVPSREGGVEIVVEELATRMVMLGYQVTCINRRGHHVSGQEFDSEKSDEYNGIRLVTVPTIEHKGLSAVSSAFFATLISAFKNFDAIHIHAEGPAAFCWIPKFLGKKVIMTCHGLDWARPRWKKSFGRKFIKYGERMAVKYADDIIVLSRGIQDYFKKTYDRDTIHIPNGINRPLIKPPKIITERWGVVHNSYILALCRLTDEKRIDLLIEAFKMIDTDKKLIIAGGSSDSGAYITKLHDLAQDDPRIIFTGFVQGQILEELYSNAYIYCLPSELEGMPLSLLEAMSYGNCCVTSDIPECTEAAGEMAIFFKTNNQLDLSSKLQMLLNKSELVEKYKSQTADYICGKYNWDDIAAKTLVLYGKSGREKLNW